MPKVQYPVYKETGTSSSTYFPPIDTSAFQKCDVIMRVKNQNSATEVSLELSKMAYEFYDENSFGESTTQGTEGPTFTITSGGNNGTYTMGMSDDIGAMLLPKLNISATSVDVEVYVVGLL